MYRQIQLTILIVHDAKHRGLYDFLREQMEIGWVIYGLEAGMEEELENFDVQHFSMGDRVPLAQKIEQGKYWVTDEKASEIYRLLNEKAKEICTLSGIPVDDLYQICVEENLQKSDGVHFQEEAYWQLARKVAESLKKALKEFP